MLGEFINPTAIEARILDACPDILLEVFVDARSGEEHICLIVVPAREYTNVCEAKILELVISRVSSVEDFQSYEIPKGLIKVSVDQHAKWVDQGLLTPLGKFIRGAISKHFESNLTNFYHSFEKHRDGCIKMIGGEDVRGKLVGLMALMLERDPDLVDKHTGHLSALGLNSLNMARISSVLTEDRFNNRHVSSAVISNMDLNGLIQCVLTGKVQLHGHEALLTQMIDDAVLPDDCRSALRSLPCKPKQHT